MGFQEKFQNAWSSMIAQERNLGAKMEYAHKENKEISSTRRKLDHIHEKHYKNANRIDKKFDILLSNNFNFFIHKHVYVISISSSKICYFLMFLRGVYNWIIFNDSLALQIWFSYN